MSESKVLPVVVTIRHIIVVVVVVVVELRAETVRIVERLGPT